MSNLIFGILTILLCAIGYYFSWKSWRIDNYRIAIILLLICGLVLRIYISTDLYLHTWDERYHALVAKNLIQHPLKPTLYDNPVLPYNYKNWSENHIWLHKQPLPLWTMAASMRLFGVNEISLRLPSIILSTIGIFLTFSIARYFFNKKVAYLSALFYSVNGLILELTGGRVATDHMDIFFLFFVELAIYYSIEYVKKGKAIYNVIVGIGLGAAILSKWLPALIVLPIWLLIVIDSKKVKPVVILSQFMVVLTTCVMIFLPWQLYIFKAFPLEASWESSYTLRHLTEVLEEHGWPFYYFLDRIRINYGELIYLPLLWFLWMLIKNTRDYKLLAVGVWFIIPLIFFSVARTKMQGYILFTSPALFIMTSAFWFMLYDYRKSHKLKWLFNIILFLLIALPIRYAIERTKPFSMRDRKPEWVHVLKKLNEQEVKNGVLLNYDRPIEAMFYTDLVVYSYIPDKEAITNLTKKGYRVIINDNGNIPAEIESIKGVTTVNLEIAD